MATFYKYLSDPKLASSILDGSIKFAPVPELNDPTEFLAPVDREALRASLVSLRRDGYSEAQFRALRQQGALLKRVSPNSLYRAVPLTRAEANAALGRFSYDLTDDLIWFLERVVADLKDNIGVFCLSQDPASSLMWAHYAANHHGFVVGYENLQIDFTPDETGVFNIPTPVTYGRRASGVTFDPESTLDIFFSKHRDWSYEREVRIIRPLDDCLRSVTTEGHHLYLASIDRRCVSTIICGSRMSKSDISLLVDLVKHRNEPTQLLQAVIKGERIDTQRIL